MSGKPVLILKEGTSRNRGRDARKSNILAGQIIAEVLKSTLGPKGMDKMLIDSLGDITITNDGATILKEIDVQHPVAKMIVEVAKTQDDEVGDGTTTAVILSGELLNKAEELLNENIHPSIIISGFQKASDIAMKTLEKVAIDVDLNDTETLMKLAVTSMRSKAVSSSRNYLARIAVDAIRQIVEERDGEIIADVDNVQIIKKIGDSLDETQLIKGIIIDKEVVHPGMPKIVKDAHIALLDSALEIEKPEFSAEIRIKKPESIKAFLDQESEMLKKMVEKIKASGANVLFCQKGIDDVAQHFLAKESILAVRRVKKSDMEKLAKATGGKIVSNLMDLKTSDLGSCGLVEERKVGNDKMVFVEDCKNPKTVSVFIRAGLERMIDEAERTMNDALYVISDVAELPKMVVGGGAVEMELSKTIRNHAKQMSGREQLAIEAFGNALEIVPKTLAQNAGIDILDIMVQLRATHEKDDGSHYGVNVYNGKVENMFESGVLEPLAIKMQAIKSAVEVASMILRIDEVIAASGKELPGAPGKGEQPEPGEE
ncbi:TCP-1/cpn60 chaperonin family protein [Candidatus Bathyarchaeota archaeon]|nr:TCP-1/cpn60 chaperonin family protein [Candidatus Bathyarchaeota archaeon]